MPVTPTDNDTPKHRRTVHGRRLSRPLRAGQKALMASLLPRLRIDPALLSPPNTAGALDPAGLFNKLDGTFEQVWLEIGFGDGQHLAIQAATHPEIGMIGCEPFLNGIAKLLTRVERDTISNIRILDDDARLLLAALENQSVSRAFILFPDPWPKTRHNKRRIINDQTIEQLARILRPGAELRIATDDPGYLVWIMAHMQRAPAFEWTARCATDWRTRTRDWPATRYEEKAIAAGRACTYLIYRRR